ncbi:hypothetical protein ACH4SP_37705 [Streptomyces sp. NPDC021093]|uniref:phage baseplate protein n=1 Tax=Streptomyces sp. NPDC021093 TaxID=3365112 RepID=UPI00378D4404
MKPAKQWSRRGVLGLGAGAAAGTAFGPVFGAGPAGAAEAAAVPASKRFSLAGDVYTLLWNDSIYTGTVLQSFAFDHYRGAIYLAQVLNESGSAGAGRLRITKTDLTGKVLGSMTLRDRNGKGWGHGVSIGVESSSVHLRLWVEVDGAVVADGDCAGTALARIPFHDNGTYYPDSPEVEKHVLVSGARNVTCAIDPVNNRLVQRYKAGSGPFRYRTYALSDVLARKYNVLAEVAQPALSYTGQLRNNKTDNKWEPLSYTGVFQGYTLHGQYLYLLDGNAYNDCDELTWRDGDMNKPRGSGQAPSPSPAFVKWCQEQGFPGAPKTSGNAHLTTVDLNTGKTVEQRHITSGESLTYREAEGMAIQVIAGEARLCYGFAGRDGEARTTTIMYKDALV